MTQDPKALNDRFAVPEHVRFVDDNGSFVFADVANGHATARIALHGGHVVTYGPRDGAPVIWVSSQAQYKPGKAIRGGVPVCWPWFADHPSDPTKPAHGVARTAAWRVAETGAEPNGSTRVRLELSDDAATREIWPHPFRLELTATVGRTLKLELTAHNVGQQPFVSAGALHSYFGVGAIADVQVHGLDGATYIDKVHGMERRVQNGPLTVDGFTDSVYQDTAADCVIDDRANGRKIRVAKRGSRSTVVWNPWEAGAAAMGDFGDREYLEMICVETANAGDDVVTVAPGASHTLATTISVE